MFNPNYMDDSSMYPPSLLRRGGMAPRRFDEFYRCYPIVMLPGPDREHTNYGGKVFLPPSALDKLTRLHITYPMLFELINGKKEKLTHAGVLEFIAEEGKIYLPWWLMETLSLDPGDLLQIKSTDLPSGTFVKLQPQSPTFLTISDPKAVLENALRNFSTLTKGDVFAFSYNDTVFSVAVLEVKPESDKHGISVVETDLEVDFAPPVGYVEPEISRPASAMSGILGAAQGGMVHSSGTMAAAINYSAIAPGSSVPASGAKAASSAFSAPGQKLRGSKTSTPKPGTPVPQGAKGEGSEAVVKVPRSGPQPLRLPPGKLFFGYEVKPLRKKDGESAESSEPKFAGAGQTLRGGAKKKEEPKTEDKGKGKAPEKDEGHRLGGKSARG